MAEKKRGSVEPIPGIEVGANEISVARNRAVEPYIKTFAFTPENVTQEGLGTLVGVFSVSDRSESSAYTVNVIASVARKEYYANPRRGAVESFESTLHRINLALSELVKNGQASWMGSLHGALAAVEGYSIHFSATGDGRVLLFREGTVSDIGDGLASEEASQHPLKTFLEISSGRLAPGDCILLTTPELLDLFSPRELERNANRLLPEGKFLRFLETAMVNELRAGAAVVLDVRETRAAEMPPKEKRKRRHDAQPETVNAWSEKAFREAAEERTKAVLESYDPEEDVSVAPDRDLLPPTNEIRIQGEAPENLDEHPLVTRARWMFEDAGHSIRDVFTHSLRNSRRRNTEFSGSVSETVDAVSQARTEPEARIPEPASVAVKPTEPNPVPAPARHARPVPPIRAVPALNPLPTNAGRPSGGRLATVFIKQSENGKPDPVTPRATLEIDSDTSPAIRKAVSVLISASGATGAFILKFLREQALPAMSETARITARVAAILARKFARTCAAVWKRFRTFPIKRQLITATAVAFLITILGTLVWKGVPRKKTPVPAPAVVETPVVAPFPPTGEKAASLAVVTPLSVTGGDIVSPVYLGNSLYLVTKTAVIDAETGRTYPLPSSDTVRLAAGMSDLNLVFLLTDRGDLYSFAPSNRAFVKNSIPFPSGFRVAAMGDYLTYLYFLEDGTGKIYRFPRADGGFGDGTLWTRSPMPQDTRVIAVSDSIFGSDGSSVSAFFRGTPLSGFSEERPVTEGTVTVVCANADVSDRVVILDAAAKRLIVRSGTGAIISQLFDESFASATTCALSGDGTTVAVTGPASGVTASLR